MQQMPKKAHVKGDSGPLVLLVRVESRRSVGWYRPMCCKWWRDQVGRLRRSVGWDGPMNSAWWSRQVPWKKDASKTALLRRSAWSPARPATPVTTIYRIKSNHPLPPKPPCFVTVHDLQLVQQLHWWRGTRSRVTIHYHEHRDTSLWELRLHFAWPLPAIRSHLVSAEPSPAQPSNSSRRAAQIRPPGTSFNHLPRVFDGPISSTSSRLLSVSCRNLWKLESFISYRPGANIFLDLPLPSICAWGVR